MLMFRTNRYRGDSFRDDLREEDLTMARITKRKNDLAQKITHRLIQASISLQEDVLEEWNTRPQGLTEAEAKARLEHYGKNLAVRGKPPAWYIQLLSCFANPFILILLFLGPFPASRTRISKPFSSSQRW
ncbi:cation-transporting P-type ATPase [Paenibacillus dendritiformis]|uniref:cation-transporting P-type ATPase n=1 Tax=Paenibacillus dendritiformis TaxID=130049 RepID=UPI001EEE3F4A|nr:cation-transporting P-type ATPase [Paenibacillus dendritiformis]